MEVVLDGNIDFNIKQKVQTIETSIPYGTTYVLTKDVPLGEQVTLKRGIKGVEEKTQTTWMYKNIELGTNITGTRVATPPVDEIVGLGVFDPNANQNATVLPPILDPKLSGTNQVTGETTPNANVTITVGLTQYQTTADGNGKFTQTLNVPLKEGEVISATATLNGKTSLPGKTIVPRDGRTPELAYSSLKTEQNGQPGTLVTITNKATGEKLGEFFVPDGAKGEKGDKGDKGDKGAKGDKGLQGLPGLDGCLLYTSPSPRDRQKSRMPSSA